MALQTCSTHKAVADAKISHEYNNSIMNDIESACNTAVNETPPRYDVFFEYTINGQGIKQPDTTFVECEATIAALKAAGYTVAHMIRYGKVKIHLRIE